MVAQTVSSTVFWFVVPVSLPEGHSEVTSLTPAANDSDKHWVRMLSVCSAGSGNTAEQSRAPTHFHVAHLSSSNNTDSSPHECLRRSSSYQPAPSGVDTMEPPGTVIDAADLPTVTRHPFSKQVQGSVSGSSSRPRMVVSRPFDSAMLAATAASTGVGVAPMLPASPLETVTAAAAVVNTAVAAAAVVPFPPVSVRSSISQGQRPRHVLFVDDDEINQRIGRRFLQRLGYTFVILADGVEVMSALRTTDQLPSANPRASLTRAPTTDPGGHSFAPDVGSVFGNCQVFVESTSSAFKTKFDVILTDIQMRQMNGDELCTELAHRGVRIPIVAMTGAVRCGVVRVLYVYVFARVLYVCLCMWHGRAAVRRGFFAVWHGVAAPAAYRSWCVYVCAQGTVLQWRLKFTSGEGSRTCLPSRSTGTSSRR